jgi:hypothetical protein
MERRKHGEEAVTMTKARQARPAKTGDIEAAKKKLEDALSGKVPRTRKPTKTQGIKELQPLIEKLRAEDYSWAEIATLLKDTGFGNKDTIRYAISDAKPKKKRVEDDENSENGATKSLGDQAVKTENGSAEPTGREQRSEHAAQRRASWKP